MAARPNASRAEKTFYLDEFRAHTLCFSAEIAAPEEIEPLVSVVGELVANGTRIVLLLAERGRTLASFERRLRDEISSSPIAELFPRRRGRADLTDLLARIHPEERSDQLLQMWKSLSAHPLFVAVATAPRLLDTGRWITGRLRIQKWVILDPRGGIFAPSGTPISFMDESMLTEVLRAGTAEWAGLQGRRKTLATVRDALRQGVQAVNLCTHAQLASELFTYEGSGTLFTLEDYCRVERLGIDDFEEVERLLERGQREGFLKERNRDEVAAILLNGFGATIGTNHLAGVCGLLTEPYKRARAGEIAGLYTITRFKGEGVGARLLRHALDHATACGLSYVFACTTDSNAADFFKRHGFREVKRSDVPRGKWKGYRRDRLSRLTVLRRELGS
jgi:N-acetylglutamate synthase-like GNAT family acetyltransferase